MKVYVLFWDITSDSQVYLGTFSTKHAVLGWMIRVNGYNMPSVEPGGIWCWTRGAREIQTTLIEADLDCPCTGFDYFLPEDQEASSR